MCRFADAGRWMFARPFFWLPLLMCGVLTLLAHWLLPVRPVHRFDLAAADKADDDSRTYANVIGISPNGNTAVARRPGTDKLFFWDVHTGQMTSTLDQDQKTEFERFFSTLNDAWIPNMVFDAGQNEHYIQFVNRHTGQASPRLPERYARSARGDLVAYSDGNANHLLDLQTQKTRCFFLGLKGENAPLVPIKPISFSADECMLAGTAEGFVVIVNVVDGSFVAKLLFPQDEPGHYPHTIAFAPNGQAIAWQSMREVVVTDLTDKHRYEIPFGILVGWNASSDLVVQRQEVDPETNSCYYPPRATHLETWKGDENRRLAQRELPPRSHFVPSRIQLWSVPRVPRIVKQSHDGKHLLFAGYVEDPPPSPWHAKVRDWLRIPERRTLHLEVSLLETDGLTLHDRWQVPAEKDREGMLQFTTDGTHLVYSDGHVVEHWPIPPRSWLISSLWGGGATLGLFAIVASWRFWRKRKRDTISPIPPPAKVPEVVDAKT